MEDKMTTMERNLIILIVVVIATSFLAYWLPKSLSRCDSHFEDMVVEGRIMGIKLKACNESIIFINPTSFVNFPTITMKDDPAMSAFKPNEEPEDKKAVKALGRAAPAQIEKLETPKIDTPVKP